MAAVVSAPEVSVVGVLTVVAGALADAILLAVPFAAVTLARPATDHLRAE